MKSDQLLEELYTIRNKMEEISTKDNGKIDDIVCDIGKLAGKIIMNSLDESQVDVKKTLDELKQEIILERLGYYDGNRSLTARSLGISVRTITNNLGDYRQQGLEEDHEVVKPRAKKKEKRNEDQLPSDVKVGEYDCCATHEERLRHEDWKNRLANR